MHAPLRAGGENVRMSRRRTVGTFIVERRRALGLSQGDLAEALRVTRTLVSRWETDKQRPGADHLDELARVLDDDGGQLASLARYDDDSDQPPLFAHPVRVGDLCRRVGDALVGYLSTDAVGPGGEPGYGWRHDIEDPAKPPSALSTAYGLRAVALTGSLDRRVSLPGVRETIRGLELPTGGWTARELSPVARPEITAVVAGVLQEAGEDAAFVADKVALVVDQLGHRAPDSELARPYVLASSLIELSRLDLDEAVGRRLVGTLVDLSLTDGGARGWPVYVRAPGTHPRPLSTVHTAVAVSAVAAWARRLADPGLDDVARSGLAWLERHAELDLDDEILRSEAVDGRSDRLPVRHFTPAWVAQAAVAAGADPSSGLVDRAMRDVLRFYEPDVALWRWPRGGGEYPTWMTYHGVAALMGWAAAHEIA
jgi:transcriptional regulator with XRE-family HTH domain